MRIIFSSKFCLQKKKKTILAQFSQEDFARNNLQFKELIFLPVKLPFNKIAYYKKLLKRCTLISEKYIGQKKKKKKKKQLPNYGPSEL